MSSSVRSSINGDSSTLLSQSSFLAAEHDAAAATKSKFVPSRRRPMDIGLPDGTNTTIVDITEKLKNTLPFQDLERNGVVYRKSIEWKVLIHKLKKVLKIFEGVAVAFVQHLVGKSVLCPVTTTCTTGGGEEPLYRLHCDHTPWILNSYINWSTSNGGGSAMGRLGFSPKRERITTVLTRLDDMLQELGVLMTTTQVERKNGTMVPVQEQECKIDFQAVHSHELYPQFEEAMCQLQVLSVEEIADPAERLAAALNVYHIMLQYAVLKLGVIDGTDKNTSSIPFYKRIQFNLEGKLYTFPSWEQWIMQTLKRDWNFSSTSPSPRRSSLEHSVAASDDGATVASDVTFSSFMSTLTSATSGSSSNNGGVRQLTQGHKTILALKGGWAMGSSVPRPFRLFTADLVFEEIDAAMTAVLQDPVNVSINLQDRQITLAKELSDTISRLDKRVLDSILPHLDLQTQQKPLIELLEGVQKYKVSYNIERDYTRNVINHALFHETNLQADVKKTGLFQRFRPPPTPSNEMLRYSTLRSLNLLDTLPEERFDRITRMAQATFNVQLVAINLIDHDRQWFMSTAWACSTGCPQGKETPSEISFCGHTICGAEGQILYLPDATEDDRFADNPLVTGPLGLRFYAGCSLSMPALNASGKTVNIGTFCICDQNPRHDFDDEQQNMLRSYAYKVRDEILARDREEERKQARRNKKPSKDKLKAKKKKLKSNRKC